MQWHVQIIVLSWLASKHETRPCYVLQYVLQCLPQTGLHVEREPGSIPACLNFPSHAPLHLLGNTILPLSPEHASSDCGQGDFQECFLLSTGK